MTNDSRTRTITAIAWCLAWGEKHNPNQDELNILHQMRQALAQRSENESNGQVVPDGMQPFVELAEQLYSIDANYKPETLSELKDKYSRLWEKDTPIGLVYGGATKIKQYVFEAAKLHDIRGASALLDRINLVDLPAFFGEGERSRRMREWLRNNGFADLITALIPELIIYSTGGSILAFCPAGLVDKLANAIEKRYTDETLTANSCAVGNTFRLLEFRFGLLQNPIENTFWLDKYKQKQQQDNPIIQAYFDQSNEHDLDNKFWQRKNFNELVGKLANQFTQRRNGNLTSCNVLANSDAANNSVKQRPSRCYPPMFETHPYLQRDETDRRAAVAETNLPGTPSFSAALARKVIVGQRSKRDQRWQQWYDNFSFQRLSGNERIEELWDYGKVRSWVSRFKLFLKKSRSKYEYYQALNETLKPYKVTEAFSLREIGNVSKAKGFVGYIYADGNNMGGYIRNKIRTPQDYREFSQQVLDATTNAVYIALKEHLQPRQLHNLTDADNSDRNGEWIYPFEIITIGGDDVLLIVPADKALDVAKTIGDEFEKQLSGFQLEIPYNPEKVHRYQGEKPEKYESQCELSMSAGVLITAENTPIYYAEELTNQLLKSSKKRAKDLKKDYNYYGGTIDFLALKAVTMIASNINDFREQGLTKKEKNLKFYAAPYTLHELGGLLATVAAFKTSKFPKSQLYQIRSLLERGRRTAILNYRYFRVRLQSEAQEHLKNAFENAWCKAKLNNGNLAPWMSINPDESDIETEITTYETIWRDLVDLYPFIITQEDSEIPLDRNQKVEEIKGV
jgi:CRISPR-associated protein Cmr2